MYSYSIITRPSKDTELDWLHDRMPAILPEPKDVQNWLDPNVSGKDALEKLPVLKKNQVAWHAVSQAVGNVKNQDFGLAKPVVVNKQAKEAGAMKKWLAGGGKKEEDKKEEDKKDGAPLPKLIKKN